MYTAQNLPTVTWGGSGCLGAEVGHGYLHTLPEHCRHSTGSSTGDGLMMMSAPDAMVSPVQAWRDDSTTTNSVNSSSGTAGVAQRHFPAPDRSDSSGSSSAAAGTAVSHNDSTTTTGGVTVSSTQEQQQQQQQLQRQKLHQQWQQLQQQTAVDAKPPQQSVTDSAGTATVAQRDSSQSLTAQQQQQQQRLSIDYSSIDLSSIGGIIDVDLSGTATQAVAPHVRARG
jgi:hypothetical protein